MKIAIIDDQTASRNHILTYLHRFFMEHYAQEKIKVEQFSSGESFLAVFSKDMFDLIFLDQYMEGLTGIESAKQIRLKDELVPLVFITTSRDHALDSYQVRAGGYLLKPFSYEDFQHTLQSLGMARLRNARAICIENDHYLLREILWCDMDGHYIQIHTQTRGIMRYRVPFAMIAEKLINYPQFLNCYKNCIVNLDHVEKLQDLLFLLTSGERLFFSKRDKKRMEEAYHNYLFHKAREDILL